MEREPTEKEIDVAKALYEHEWKGQPHPEPFKDGCKKYWVSCASAAIRATHKPTEDMIHAAMLLNLADEMDCVAIFQAMVDAASPPD